MIGNTVFLPDTKFAEAADLKEAKRIGEGSWYCFTKKQQHIASSVNTCIKLRLCGRPSLLFVCPWPLSHSVSPWKIRSFIGIWLKHQSMSQDEVWDFSEPCVKAPCIKANTGLTVQCISCNISCFRKSSGNGGKHSPSVSHKLTHTSENDSETSFIPQP